MSAPEITEAQAVSAAIIVAARTVGDTHVKVERTKLPNGGTRYSTPAGTNYFAALQGTAIAVASDNASDYTNRAIGAARNDWCRDIEHVLNTAIPAIVNAAVQACVEQIEAAQNQHIRHVITRDENGRVVDVVKRPVVVGDPSTVP